MVVGNRLDEINLHKLLSGLCPKMACIKCTLQAYKNLSLRLQA